MIEDAIKQKQQQWSRNRNHPTKAILSKRYIGMIPEIRKVMEDPKLRQKEAEDAKRALYEGEQLKLSKIDRHISLLMSKGSMSKKEIAKLAKMHAVEASEIQKRVKKKETLCKIDRQLTLLMKKGEVTGKKLGSLAKRYSVDTDKLRELTEKKKQEHLTEIRSYLEFCENQGYITEGAVAHLAGLYGVGEGEILMRLKCPLRKGGTKKKAKPEPFDKTLEKLINDNLSVVGKSSLYDFLDLPQDTALNVLKEKSREKEMDIRKIGQKDAVTTASSALAGHCIVIFKAKESRIAYDLTMSRSRLSELDSDINAAGIEGKVLPEYLDILVRKAMSIGMDIEEAFDYIREYCQKEKWVLKEKKKLIILDKKRITFLEKWTVRLDPKEKSFWIFCGSIVAVILIFFGGISLVGGLRVRSAYTNAMDSLEGHEKLENKEKVLQEFLKNYGDSKYAITVKKKSRQIRKQMEKEDFDTVIKEADPLYAGQAFEKMKSLYDWYLKRHPAGKNASAIREKLAELPELIDDRDYEQVSTVEGEFSERIKVYNQYLKKHPEGKHIDDIRELILGMVGEYYDALKKELSVCEEKSDWNGCIELCEGFTERFGGTEQAAEVDGLRAKFQKRIQYQRDLSELRQKADLEGTDYEAARQIYLDYMEANPETPSYLKNLITKEMYKADLDNLRHESKLKEPDYMAAKRVFVEFLEAKPESPAYVTEVLATEIARLDGKIQEQIQKTEAWEKLSDYCEDPMNDISERVARVERYIRENPSSPYLKKANSLLKQLAYKKKIVAVGVKKKQEKDAWRKLFTAVKNKQVSLDDKIQQLEAYIAQAPPEDYRKEAIAILEQFRQKKQSLAERQKLELANRARRENELKRIRGLVQKQGGRFSENGNGTITDKTSGLTWCTLDSLADLGQCIDYETAIRYVKQLRTGGHQNWRLPTIKELVGLYKTQPFFPVGEATWYWSSEAVWHGWNKQAYIVTSKPETAWSKSLVEMKKCGAVRAVR
ncbi:MAG: hypothetical protein B6245_16495 [Desulfobacteraceae bacterium 4572_88]|nr:MAG: hypothetical protein B6245_16495 [Desulfobacteraceae bacterium 4572_88]